MDHPRKILLIEDDEDDYVITRKLLSEAKEGVFKLQWVQTYEQAQRAVDEDAPEAILMDYDLGWASGLELAGELVRRGCRAPIIILTGQGNYSVEIEAMQAGAADYLVKGEVTAPLLERAIRYAIERKQTEDALRHANERLANSNQQLSQAKDELEQRVLERTRELARTNQDLLAEIGERKRIQEKLQVREARMGALAELSRVLAETISDYQGLLDQISRRIAEVVGDACVVSLLSDDGQWLDVASLHHPNPETARLFRQTIVPRQWQTSQGLRSQVIRTGEPLLFPVLSAGQFEAIKRQTESPTLEEYRFHSLLIVPLRAQSQVIGTLGVSRDTAGRPYTEEDLIFLQDLANRAAMAILQARLLQAMQAELGERKRIEAELAEIQRRMIDSLELERLNMAQELHDGPMQELYGIIFEIEALNDLLRENLPADPLAPLKARMSQVIKVLRATAIELRPPSLTPFGLEKAIRSHADHLQLAQPNLTIHLDLSPDGQTLSEQVRLALYRIYQVATNNIVRHARASRLEVRLILSETVTLEIQDDGRGFEMPRRWIDLARRGHLGLVGAAERAEAVGGKLEILSTLGRGTLVRVVVPRVETLSMDIPGVEAPGTNTHQVESLDGDGP